MNDKDTAVDPTHVPRHVDDVTLVLRALKALDLLDGAFAYLHACDVVDAVAANLGWPRNRLCASRVSAALSEADVPETTVRSPTLSDPAREIRVYSVQRLDKAITRTCR